MSESSNYETQLRRLDLARRERKLSFRALGDRFGVSNVTMARWLRGGMPVRDFFAIAEFLGHDVHVIKRNDQERESRQKATMQAFINEGKRPCCESSRTLDEVRKLVAE